MEANAHNGHRHALRTFKHSKALEYMRRASSSSALNKEVGQLINTWLARAELANSLVGLDLMDMSTGEEIVCVNGQRRFTPASTAKLIVTACAYETLGPSFTYKTRFCTKGRIDDGKLDSDVLVVPSQDPTLSRADLGQMLASLKSHGLKLLAGNFVQTDVPGGQERFLAEWLSEDWAQNWMPVSSSLVIDRNISSPSFFSKTKISVTGPADSRNALNKTLLAAEYTPGWLSFDKISQSIFVYQAKDKEGSQALKVVANPDAYNIALINNMAGQMGIKVVGHRPWLADFGTLTTLAEHQSAPLALILKTTLKESDNLYAQQILRTLGLTQSSTNPKNTLNLEQRGLQKIMDWLQCIGIPAHEVVLWDGCGLSRKDYLSPHALNLILRHMALHPATASYLTLLNQAIISPKGSFQFKTGAMDSVRGITGVLENFEGHKLALTILVNGHTPSVRDLRTSIGVLTSQLAQTSIANQIALPKEIEKTVNP